MGVVAGGFASSHAFTFVKPEGWERFRDNNRNNYLRRYGELPPVHPGVHAETLESAARRYGRVEAGLDKVREAVRRGELDALVIVGDDQNENFDASAIPQIAIYTGEDFAVAERFLPDKPVWPNATELARDLQLHAVDAGFDVTTVTEFREGTLRSHAHGEIISNILSTSRIPVALVFLNAIHVPALSPARCFGLGRTMAEAVRDRRPAGERVGFYASGGLSHFTAGYPWRAYTGPHTHGSIVEEFDRECIRQLESGRGKQLADLTSQQLLDTGNIELRSWICAVGAMADDVPWECVYEPIPHALMGMAVGSSAVR